MDKVKMRMEESEDTVGDGEVKIMEHNEDEKKRGRKLFDHEVRLREHSNSIMCNNIHIIGVPEEERDKGAGLFEQIIAENFPNLGKETGIQVQEAQRAPLKINKNR